MRFSVIFWSAWAVVGTLSRASEDYARNNMPLLGFLAVAYVPLAISLWRASVASAKVAAAKAEFFKQAGSPKYSHFENDTAVAIDPGAGTLTLKVKSSIKTYPFADIREWTSAQGQAATFIPMGGLANGVAAGAAAMGAAANAAAMTGFFVKVRDVEHPEWRVSMFKKSDRNRWIEILQQEINELRGSMP